MTDPHQPARSTTVPIQAGQPVVAARKRGPLDYALALAMVIAIGGVAFAAGRTTAPAQASGPNAGGLVPTGSFNPGFNPGAGGPGLGGGGGFGGVTIEGTVKSVDSSSVVIETADGQEVTVSLDANTTYHESSSADAGSVAAGDHVAVRVSGAGRFGGGAPTASDEPSFSATDVTVER